MHLLRRRSTPAKLQPREWAGLRVITQPGEEVVSFKANPQIEIHEDCVFHPIVGPAWWCCPMWGVYDKEGERIDAATLYVRPGKNLNGQSARIPVDVSDAPYAPADAYFYVGHILGHYGHFLCSSMTRLWALPQFAGLPLVAHGAGNPEHWFTHPSLQFIRTLFGGAGIVSSDFGDFQKPVRFRRLIVARPSFEEEHFVHSVYGTAARAWGDRLVKAQDLSAEREIIYLSKTRHYKSHPQGIGNESDLIAHLEWLGVPIIYPEELTIPEQVALFRSTKRILGQSGSAFHTSILAPRKDQVLVQIVPRTVVSANHALMDMVNCNRSIYVLPEVECVERPGDLDLYMLTDPKTTASHLVDFAMSL